MGGSKGPEYSRVSLVESNQCVLKVSMSFLLGGKESVGLNCAKWRQIQSIWYNNKDRNNTLNPEFMEYSLQVSFTDTSMQVLCVWAFQVDWFAFLI